MLSSLEGDAKIFVLDAKYYQYGENRETKRLLGTGSIIKQIAYAEFIETMRKQKQEIPKGDIYKAFVLPYATTFDESKYPIENFGYADCNWKNSEKKTYHKIYGILLDVCSIMQRHPNHSDKDIAELAAKIEVGN